MARLDRKHPAPKERPVDSSSRIAEAWLHRSYLDLILRSVDSHLSIRSLLRSYG